MLMERDFENVSVVTKKKDRGVFCEGISGVLRGREGRATVGCR